MTSAKSPITTHVLDTSQGAPAVGVSVKLERVVGNHVDMLGRTTTDDDGRVINWPEPFVVHPGTYRVTFATAAYFERSGQACFYPEVAVLFEVADASAHHHVPLLISPFGYSTYRGS